jgi:nitrate reductase gamma subunit
MWAKDLRRGEIVAFGSFPFAYFFATFGFDTYRFFNHGYDMRYAPWPFTSAAAIEQTQNEKFLTVGIAAGGAIVIALVDYIIVRVKRSRERAETGNLPDGTPIINRRPLYGDDGDEAGTSGGGD